MKPEDKDVHDPLSRQAFESIVYNAVGRGSEVNTFPAFALAHSTGNSGWSTGIVQWDFGQPGRGHKVADLLAGYQAWAMPEARFTEEEMASLSARLQRRGQVGNALGADERDRLDAYLRSGVGREFVETLNREQVDYKWRRVGQPLSELPWLARLGADDPAEAIEIVTMASKLFNQNEIRGRRLLDHLQHNELSADGTADWIGSTGIDGLNPHACKAIVAGRDHARAGARLLGELQYGTSATSDRWRSIVQRGDASLSRDFEFNPDLQFFDAMLRDPREGLRLLHHIEQAGRGSPIHIRGVNALARKEMAEITAVPPDDPVLTTTRGTEYALRESGWSLARPATGRRAADNLDYTEGMRLRPPRPTTSADPRRDEALRTRLLELYESHGAAPAPLELDAVTGTLLREVERSGRGRITHLAFAEGSLPNSGRSRVIAWQGDPSDPATPWSTLSVRDALAAAEDGYTPQHTDIQPQDPERWDRSGPDPQPRIRPG